MNTAPVTRPSRPQHSIAPYDRLGLGRFLLDDDVAAWARRTLADLTAGRSIPRYGSQTWRGADRRLQAAAAVRAAEAYRREEMYLSLALADAEAAEHWCAEAREAAEFRQIARGVRAMGSPTRPTHAELVARRAEVKRPGVSS